ncbi:MAG: phage tail protein [Tildeniella torsiva UHER 1998/13D]|jgi:phage tail-like protein|nr:phage tail protein [Tildeniella torsiva UHER 1998/13D]
MARTHPYPAFNFLVNLNGPIGPEEILGGFSDVSGLGAEVTIAEYRNGNEKENRVRKVAGVYKASDVTLKRGVVDSSDLWAWFDDTRRNGPEAQREVVITLRDEAGNDIQAWKLRGVVPMKYTAPTFAAKGGGDLALEELVLSAESIEFEKAG